VVEPNDATEKQFNLTVDDPKVIRIEGTRIYARKYGYASVTATLLNTPISDTLEVDVIDIIP